MENNRVSQNKYMQYVSNNNHITVNLNINPLKFCLVNTIMAHKNESLAKPKLTFLTTWH